jgi:hypothetical protein
MHFRFPSHTATRGLVWAAALAVTVPLIGSLDARANSVTELQVLDAVSPTFLNAVSEEVRPTPDGAMGRNRGAWYNVLDQRDCFRAAAAGIRGKNAALISRAFSVATESFEHQTSGGDFAYNLQRVGQPQGALVQASQAAFFASDLAHTLLLLNESPWFQASGTTVGLRAQIPAFRQKLSLTLGYLMDHRSDLMQDNQAANRLMIYGEAYYLSGVALGRSDALSAGDDFVRASLAQETQDGTFLELHGFDSSYQNVSISEAEYVYLNMSGDDALKPVLWAGIQRGYQREVASLEPSGEISTTGNTRVGPGSIPAQHGAQVHSLDRTAAAFAFSYYAAITSAADDAARAASVDRFYFSV